MGLDVLYSGDCQPFLVRNTVGSEGKPSILFRLALIHVPPQTGFPTPDADDKKFNSRLVAPISSGSLTPVVSEPFSLTPNSFASRWVTAAAG